MLPAPLAFDVNLVALTQASLLTHGQALPGTSLANLPPLLAALGTDLVRANRAWEKLFVDLNEYFGGDAAPAPPAPPAPPGP